MADPRRRAVQDLADAMRERGAHTLFVSSVPGIGSPFDFYRRCGFVDTGKVMEGERILRMPLRA